MSEEVTKKILKEMEQMSKGGEGSGQKGHETEEQPKRKLYPSISAERDENRRRALKEKYLRSLRNN